MSTDKIEVGDIIISSHVRGKIVYIVDDRLYVELEIAGLGWNSEISDYMIVKKGLTPKGNRRL
jgi:hypothetical protein